MALPGHTLSLTHTHTHTSSEKKHILTHVLCFKWWEHTVSVA